MGNSLIIKRINFEDMQESITTNKIIINTLTSDDQECLIKNTLDVNHEVKILNKQIERGNFEEVIIIYGSNSSDNKVYDKYKQLLGLGFSNIYIYIGGIFEWLLLQDIYGFDLFPTTTRNHDLLSYKGEKKINLKLLRN
tara:strand:+ start:1713 stop:2129 length:417 start_codon:yes stop_codon:yes gene_type:complete